VLRIANNSPTKPIGLSEDGKTFVDLTASRCIRRLEWLRGLGYNVPQSALDRLQEEQGEAGCLNNEELVNLL